MTQPLLLDLFAGASGAGEGYHRAGFRVVGVDLDPKPLRHNPHEHYVGDALAVLDTLIAGGVWQGRHLGDFAAIHASPPCQHASIGAARWRVAGREYARLIEPTRERLIATGLPFILENVIGARLLNTVTLCGTMFGLRVIRHRRFESPLLLFAAGPCQHHGDIKHDRAYVTVAGHGGEGSNRYDDWCEAMGIDWMPKATLAQAIPPAYTHWIGAQLMSAITAQEKIA